jgi:peptidoglycan hydrolase-like protein with peptidoglycan-binding domain
MPLGDYKVGDSGSGVSDLQGYLRQVGYNVPVDGQYGGLTRAAVLAFQSARRIRVDGIAGPETLIALSQARAEGWRAPVTTIGVTTPTGAPDDPAVPPKAQSKATGFLIILAVAVGVWFFMKRDG